MVNFFNNWFFEKFQQCVFQSIQLINWQVRNGLINDLKNKQLYWVRRLVVIQEWQTCLPSIFRVLYFINEAKCLWIKRLVFIVNGKQQKKIKIKKLGAIILWQRKHTCCFNSTEEEGLKAISTACRTCASIWDYTYDESGNKKVFLCVLELFYFHWSKYVPMQKEKTRKIIVQRSKVLIYMYFN